MLNIQRSLSTVGSFWESHPEEKAKVQNTMNDVTAYLAQFRADNIVQDAECNSQSTHAAGCRRCLKRRMVMLCRNILNLGDVLWANRTVAFAKLPIFLLWYIRPK